VILRLKPLPVRISLLRFFFISLSIVLLAGCAGLVQRPVISPQETSWQVIKRAVDRNHQQLKTLKGRARLVVESPQQSFSASSNIVYKKPDSVYVKIEAAFGIDVGLLFADGDSFIIYSPQQNLYYTGSLDSIDLQHFLYFKITFDKLLQALTGTSTIDDLSHARLTKGSDDFVLTSENGLIKYWIDPAKGVVKRVEIRDSQNRLWQREEYQRFVSVKGVTLARTIRVLRPQERQSFTLFYSQLDVNGKVSPKDFRIKIPQSALKIPL